MDYHYELKMKVRDYECDLQGIVNNDDQLVVAIARGCEGQAGRGGLRRHLAGGHDGAVLDGLQGHFVGSDAADTCGE